MCYNLSVGDFVEEYDELVDEKVRNLSIDPNHDLEEERKRCLMQMVKNNRSLLD
jgi:hypothetical protein